MSAMAAILTLARFCEPASELHFAESQQGILWLREGVPSETAWAEASR